METAGNTVTEIVPLGIPAAAGGFDESESVPIGGEYVRCGA